jgi:hypothetical protein
MTRRAAAVALALLPAAAVWAAPGAELLIGLGLLGFGGGLLLLAQRPGEAGRVAAAIGLVALPAAAGLRMEALSRSFEPFSLWLAPQDLARLTLPIASGFDFDAKEWLSGPPLVIVNLDRHGQALWKSRVVSFAEIDRILRDLRARAALHGEGLPGLLVRMDRDSPALHLGWLVAAARAADYADVSVAADKFASGWYRPEEAEALGGVYHGGYWPEVRLPLPLEREGTRVVRILVTGWERGTWGYGKDVQVVDLPTGFVYELDGRQTSELHRLGSWMREAPPAWIEAERAVPVKFIVAVQNELRKAGHPPAALVPSEPAPENVRDRQILPYPLR